MPGQRLLVVEDEGIVALDIQSKLESMGYVVSAVVGSAEEAVQSAARLHPDLVLMDIQLEGGLDGVDAAERITKELQIPVVYLTAYSDERTLNRAKAAQPLGYLLKPFGERELYTTVEIAIYKHRMEAERTRLEAQLHESQKMEAIAQLTAGVAHHFNLMLQGIIGNLDLAAAEAPDELLPFLDDAVYDADRAARLVRQLMLFYRQEQAEHTPVDVGDLLEEIARMCRGIFPRRIAIHVDAAEALPPVSGNRAQLRQCLVNLCANARDALRDAPPETAVISLAVRVAEPAATAGRRPAHDARAFVRIDVTDTGVGMDGATQARIFEPFFTTKDAGGPAGLGLAAVYGIVRDHDGWIECDSEPGRGTTVSVFLPASGGAAGDRLSRVPVTEPSALPNIADLRPYRGTESILVIADVDRLRKVLDLMLERNGYRVHLGRDGQDGVALFRHEHKAIDLVIVALSQAPSAASVEEVLHQILRIDGQARTLIVTARPEDASHWAGAAAVLLHPFNTYQLLKSVRAVLDA